MREEGITDIEKSVRQFARSVPSEASVLDVGCGERPYEKYFETKEYIGIDVQVSGRPGDRKKPDIYFDGINIPLEDGRVDVIICTEVIEHAIEPEMLVAEMYRVLRPKGRVLITVPFIWGLHELPYDFKRYTENGLSKLLADKGFVVEASERLTTGAAALKMLVSSEMNYHEVVLLDDSSRKSWKRKILRKIASRWWRIQMLLWKRLYNFDRLYINTLVVATKR